MLELELVRQYGYPCDCHDKEIWAYHQRFSPNSCPSNEKLTDVELLTLYLYCRRYENKHTQREVEGKEQGSKEEG